MGKQISKQCDEKGCRHDSHYQFELRSRTTGLVLSTRELCQEGRDRLDLTIDEALSNPPARKKRARRTAAPTTAAAEKPKEDPDWRQPGKAEKA